MAAEKLFKQPIYFFSGLQNVFIYLIAGRAFIFVNSATVAEEEKS